MKRVFSGVLASRAGVVGDRGAGADKTSAETRRHPRHVRALCRHHRRRQRDRGEDGGGGFRRRGARPQDRDHRADHLNKADLSANIARDMLDNQGVEMIFDVAASATALAAGEIAKARNKIIIFNGPASIRAHQRGLRSLHRALRVRHVWAGQCDRACRRQAGPRHLVLPDRRLCVRTGPGKGHHQCGAEDPAARCWAACGIRSTPPTSRRSCCRRRLRRPR